MLDTDILSLLERDSDSSALQFRLEQVPVESVVTTVITYEEQTLGWMARSAKANSTAKMAAVYDRRLRHIDTFCSLRVLPFDAHAAEIFDGLRVAPVRIGTMDMKIAAITIANDGTLLSRNLTDFHQVPGLRAEDWSTRAD